MFSSERKFSARLRSARLQRGIRAIQLAKQIGVNRSYISLLEAGKRGNPSDDVICSLADALGVSSDWLKCVSDAVFVDQTTVPREDARTPCGDLLDARRATKLAVERLVKQVSPMIDDLITLSGDALDRRMSQVKTRIEELSDEVAALRRIENQARSIAVDDMSQKRKSSRATSAAESRMQ